MHVNQESIQKSVEIIQPQPQPHNFESQTVKSVVHPNFPTNKLGPSIVNKIFQPIYNKQPAIQSEGKWVQMIPIKQVEMILYKK